MILSFLSGDDLNYTCSKTNMINNRNIIIFITALMVSETSFTQANKPAIDYLHVPGPIRFENKSYDLSWTAHPAANFYKQEYLVKDDDAGKFHMMILMDVVTGETAIKNVVATKVAELKKMKEGNPMINYEVVKDPESGEYMIDFLLTANAPDGSISIAERNVYRYKTFADKTGHTGVLLFGISSRVYGSEVTPFFASLKSNRKDLMDKVAQVVVPAINIRN